MIKFVRIKCNDKITTMAGRGGIRSTSFTSETAPKGRGGHKHDKTKIKEELGLTGWEALCDFIKTDGADKLKTEMLKLTGKDYVIALSSLVEFVKPKLNRTTLDGDVNVNLRKTVIHIEPLDGCELIK